MGHETKPCEICGLDLSGRKEVSRGNCPRCGSTPEQRRDARRRKGHYVPLKWPIIWTLATMGAAAPMAFIPASGTGLLFPDSQFGIVLLVATIALAGIASQCWTRSLLAREEHRSFFRDIEPDREWKLMSGVSLLVIVVAVLGSCHLARGVFAPGSP